MNEIRAANARYLAIIHVKKQTAAKKEKRSVQRRAERRDKKIRGIGK
jgi:hypothetical protein